jgi:hypothetical protein|tara:strand:+ start:578 stop:1618 length:1041 start_codon:yes stop_codon:yes gene_type:complete
MAIIDKPSDYFNTVLYTGNGGTQAITGVGFKPDLSWLKDRDGTPSHVWHDVIRGVTKRIMSNNINAEDTGSQINSFDTDGFTLSNNNNNTNGNGFAAWNWLAAGNQGSSNTNGSINTTYTSVNTTSGFSISSYTGSGSNATVGHGLGVTPKVILVKCVSATGNWKMHLSFLAPITSLNLSDTSSLISTASVFNSMATLNSTVFSVGTEGDTNSSNVNYIAYCFAEKQGFSKFGSYTGNGNADGTFVYLGFKPAFTLFKKTNATSEWFLYDNKRLGYNVTEKVFEANTTSAEDSNSGTYIDYLSNGFKLRGTSGNTNTSGSTYIYLAFAENPFVTSTANGSIPTTAR